MWMQLNFKGLYEERFPSSPRPPDYGQINYIACELNCSLKSQWYFCGEIRHAFSFTPFLSKTVAMSFTKPINSQRQREWEMKQQIQNYRFQKATQINSK